jgi:hypothetical protein
MAACMMRPPVLAVLAAASGRVAPVMPLCPREPITMMPASCAWAASTISRPACP